MNIAVLGANGRMGQAICKRIESEPDLQLVAAIGSQDDLALVVDAEAEAVVDVTNAGAARENLPWLAERGIAAVVGTTGFDTADVDRFHTVFSAAERPCFLVPNFSIGAVLLMRFAEMAAPHFGSVEIVELHHNNKRDAPSGTARLTADKIATARTKPWETDATEQQLSGARGADVEGVRVHSVRLQGLLAHEEVLFGGPGQSLTLRHDSYDRESFMPGVVVALKALAELPVGVTKGLETVLDLG